MIPKIIHYCWFGRGEKPVEVQNCIDTWKNCLPDYQIIEWNEDNFDINNLKYTKDAYEAKKYAFVSDVARVNALYTMGGIYLDTDVVVYKTFDSILDAKCVLGFEQGNYIATSFMACDKEFELMQEFKELYDDLEFYDKDGSIIQGTNVTKLTKLLDKRGLVRNNQYQQLGDTVIYPQEYFSPYDYGNCIRQNTENTICEHLFFVSWMSKTTRMKKKIKQTIVKVFGPKMMLKLRRLKR